MVVHFGEGGWAGCTFIAGVWTCACAVVVLCYSLDWQPLLQCMHASCSSGVCVMATCMHARLCALAHALLSGNRLSTQTLPRCWVVFSPMLPALYWGDVARVLADWLLLLAPWHCLRRHFAAAVLLHVTATGMQMLLAPAV